MENPPIGISQQQLVTGSTGGNGLHPGKKLPQYIAGLAGINKNYLLKNNS